MKTRRLGLLPAAAASVAARAVRPDAGAGDSMVGRGSRVDFLPEGTAPARSTRRATGDRPPVVGRGHVLDLGLIWLPGVLGDFETGRALPEQYVGAALFLVSVVLAIAWCVWCWRTGRGNWLL